MASKGEAMDFEIDQDDLSVAERQTQDQDLGWKEAVQTLEKKVDHRLDQIEALLRIIVGELRPCFTGFLTLN